MIFLKKMMHKKIFLAPGTSYYRCVIYGTAWYFLYIFTEETKVYWIFKLWWPFFDVTF